MIILNNLTKIYNNQHLAVDNVSLQIKKGEIFGFLGHNGAGKSTTLRMITGILNATEGEILVNGVDIKKNPTEAKFQFGYVPDSPDIFLRLKGIEYLNFMADVYGVSTEVRQKRIKDMAEKFEITNALGSQIKGYSHGMRQKIVIIGALLHNPDIWILDEPLTGLDPKAAFILKEMMREHVKQGKTVLFSTHVLEVAERLCDRIGIINKGKLHFAGTIEQLKKHYKEDESLENMFLEMIENE